MREARSRLTITVSELDSVFFLYVIITFGSSAQMYYFFCYFNGVKGVLLLLDRMLLAGTRRELLTCKNINTRNV